MKKVEEELLMPAEFMDKGFVELKNKGFLFTYANSAKEFFEKKYAIRLVGQAPASHLDLKPNQITIGPFPLKRKHYSFVKDVILQDTKEFSDNPSDQRGVLCSYLAFQKIQYEKLGVTGNEYSIRAELDDIVPLVNLLDFFEIENPVIGDNFVWFYPKNECRELICGTEKKRKKLENYSWWNTVVTLEKNIKPDTIEDSPERFSLFPLGIFKKWARYLPSHIEILLFDLFITATKGGKFKIYESISEFLEVIDTCLTRVLEREFRSSYQPDRELLIKELYEYNSIVYPIDASSTFDFLQRINIITTRKVKGNLVYLLSKRQPNPNKILKFPPGWHDRAKLFANTGQYFVLLFI